MMLKRNILLKKDLVSAKHHRIRKPVKGGFMRTVIRNSVIAFTIFVLVIVPFSAVAQDYDQNPFEKKEEARSGAIAFDALIVRPVSLGAIVAGSLLFVIALPVTSFTGETRLTYEKLIKEPARYTFKRPMGEFSLK